MELLWGCMFVHKIVIKHTSYSLRSHAIAPYLTLEEKLNAVALIYGKFAIVYYLYAAVAQLVEQ